MLYLPLALLFVVGALLSRLVAGRLSTLGRGTLLAALGLTSIGPFADHGSLGAPGYVALIATFTAAVWAAATGRLAWLGRTPLVFLGAISYPLYLVHQILGYAIIRDLEARGWSAAVAIAAALLAAVALAALIRVGVEVPAQRAIRRAWATGWSWTARPHAHG